ncbi:MAG: hypothetical protein ACYC1Y_01875 [Minisyncoccota bacterium]
MTHTRKLLVSQALMLLLGAMYAWSKLVPQISNFQSAYGTLFRFSDIAIPNPLATACLYGSIAFLVALFWSLTVYQKPSLVSERRLRNFLLLCVVFAASVFLSEVAAYYKLFATGISVTCSPGVTPFKTPCFYGMIFFIGAFISSVYATGRLVSVSETLP